MHFCNAAALSVLHLTFSCFAPGIGTLFYSLHNGYVFIEALYLSITIGSTVGRPFGPRFLDLS